MIPIHLLRAVRAFRGAAPSPLPLLSPVQTTAAHARRGVPRRALMARPTGEAGGSRGREPKVSTWVRPRAGAGGRTTAPQSLFAPSPEAARHGSVRWLCASGCLRRARDPLCPAGSRPRRAGRPPYPPPCAKTSGSRHTLTLPHPLRSLRSLAANHPARPHRRPRCHQPFFCALCAFSRPWQRRPGRSPRRQRGGPARYYGNSA